MFTTPEDHAANPPESWEVVKAAPRVWRLLIAGDVAQTFTTRREAEEATQSGRLVETYRKEGRWFAGEQIPGWKPYRPPLHRLTTTYTSGSGTTRTMTTDSADVTAAEAQRRKVQLLRDTGRAFTEGPGWVEHRDGRGYTVRLEWADTTTATGAGAAKAGDPREVAARALADPAPASQWPGQLALFAPVA